MFFGDAPRLVEIGRFRHDGDFVSAVTVYRIAPHDAYTGLGAQTQDFVTLLMAETIIYLLEAVEVQHDQRNGRSFRGRRHQRSDAFLECAVIENAR